MALTKFDTDPANNYAKSWVKRFLAFLENPEMRSFALANAYDLQARLRSSKRSEVQKYTDLKIAQLLGEQCGRHFPSIAESTHMAGFKNYAHTVDRIVEELGVTVGMERVALGWTKRGPSD